MTDIDHEYTDDIICPYCGETIDSTDYRCDGNMEGKEICESCGKEFEFEGDVEVTWITNKILEMSKEAK